MLNSPCNWRPTEKKNLKPIHQLYSFNFQGEHQIILNSSYNAETQRHLQVLLLFFKEYSQAVNPAWTESERNDLTAEIAAATLQHCSGVSAGEGGERESFLKRRCISSLDPKLSAWETFCTHMQTETKLKKAPTNIHFFPLLQQPRELLILNSYFGYPSKMQRHEKDKHSGSHCEPALQSQHRTVANLSLNLCSCHCSLMPRTEVLPTSEGCLQDQPHLGARGFKLIPLHWFKSRLLMWNSSKCDICT